MTICRLLLLVAISMTGKVVSQNYVCLKAVVIENQVLLECKIDKFSYTVEFISPSGSAYGSCHSLTPPELKAERPIDCGNNIIQYIDRKTTVLRLENPKALLGVWTCKHGSGWSNDTINITSLFIEQNVQPGITNGPTSNHDSYCLGLVHVAVVSLIFLIIGFVLFCISYLVFCRTSGDGIKDTSLNKQQDEDYEKIPLLERQKSVPGEPEIDTADWEQNGNSAHNQHLCMTCGRNTTFAYCSCKRLFCETCSYDHNRSNKGHHIVQIRHDFDHHNSSNRIMCKECSNSSATHICKECLEGFCDSCILNHKSRSIKPIIPSCTPFKFDSGEGLEIESRRYMYKLELPEQYAFISGLASVYDEMVAAIDYEHSYLYLFKKEKLVFSQKLSMEPKALTTVEAKKIAITFPYEKIILIYEIQLDKAVEISKDRISLRRLGKPFRISYNKGYFAVEIGEGKRGCIAIISADGGLKYKIINKDYSFGYFTGNTLRLALDMSKQLLYISAIGKQAIYCIDLTGTIKWHITVPSPREIHIVPTDRDDTTHLLFASNKGNAVYQLIEKDEHLNKRNLKGRNFELEDVKNPEYITYNSKNKLLCVGTEDNIIQVFKCETGLTLF